MKPETYDKLTENMFLMIPLIKTSLLGDCKVKPDNKMIHSQYHVLGILNSRGALPISEIGKIIGLSKSNMTFVIDSLISQKRVIRLSDPKDRRIVTIESTKKGKEDLESAKNKLRQEFKKRIITLSDEEIEDLSSSLEITKNLLSKLNPEKNKK